MSVDSSQKDILPGRVAGKGHLTKDKTHVTGQCDRRLRAEDRAQNTAQREKTGQDTQKARHRKEAR